MRRLLFLLLILIGLTIPIVHVGAAEVENTDRQIIVQLSDPTLVSNVESWLIRVPTSSILERQHIFVFQIPTNMDYDTTIETLKKQNGVLKVEPNEVRTIESSVTQEPYYRYQWYFDTINLPKAYGLLNLTTTVKVAVMDTGVDASHPDLAGRVLPGFDFVNQDSDPTDDNGHGTFVSGIIAANVDGSGIGGMAPNVKILPVKVGNANGDILSTDIIEGIYFAIDQKVDVINMSYGGSSDNSLERQALQKAYDQGIILVAAAGNDGISTPVYPAFYQTVINVAATNTLSSSIYAPIAARADFSNYGDKVDVSAPGVDIISTWIGGKYYKGDGTSFAAPMVSGLAAVMKAKHPTWSPAMIEWAIEKGALSGNYTTGLWERQLGYGVIDIYQSMVLPALDLSRDAPDVRQNGQTITLNSTVKQPINMPNDQDWYKLVVPSNMDVTFSTTSGVLNLQGELYRENDTTSFMQLWKGAQTGDSVIKLSKGTYYLKLTEENSHWSDTPYSLTISGDYAVVFSDISTSYTHYDGIQALVKMGAINGYPMPDGTRKFRPEDKLSREHAAKIFANVLDLPVPDDVPTIIGNFKDVKSNNEYADAIASTYAADIFKGNNGYFMPGPMTREQMATIIVRAFGLTDNGEPTDVILSNVSPSHQENVKILKQHDITNQVNFRPSEYVTRAQFATFVYRAMLVASGS